MSRDLREQACWLLLAFECGLSTLEINGIIESWCRRRHKTLEEFFSTSSNELRTEYQLSVELIKKVEQAKAKLVGQSFLLEQLSHNSIHLLTVLDDDYPKSLKSTLKANQLPPVLCYAGNLQVLEHTTIAIIGSRNAVEESLTFTREISRNLAKQGANIISGNARGVDRAAYEGAVNVDGYTTVVLPHGIRKLSGVQMRDLQPKIVSGKVLLLSQFHPDAQWTVGRAMERNRVVTGLAKVVIVAESDIHGGTWDGANGALAQKRSLYVCQSETFSTLPGNKALIKKGGRPIPWPKEDLADVLSQILDKGSLESQEKIQLYEAPLINQEQVSEELGTNQEQVQEVLVVNQEPTNETLEISQEQVQETLITSQEQIQEHEDAVVSQRENGKTEKQKDNIVKKKKRSSPKKKETQSKGKKKIPLEQLPLIELDIQG